MSCELPFLPSYSPGPETASGRPPHQPTMFEGTLKAGEKGAPVTYVVIPASSQPPKTAPGAPFLFTQPHFAPNAHSSPKLTATLTPAPKPHHHKSHPYIQST